MPDQDPSTPTDATPDAPADVAPDQNSAPSAPHDTGTAAEQTPPSSSPDVEALRVEVADWRGRAEKAQQDIVDKIAKALGIGGADETPTVEQVTEQLTAAQREARERAVDLAVYRAAPAAGADPDALLDSASFRKRVADLDPAAERFADQVGAAITEAVKANPRLSATPAAPPRSGGQITGGSASSDDDLGALSVEDYIKRTRKRG
ncbi:hypothetical protein GCM10012275_39630 [Longimycelium tulufanense]|uniref:Scaffolding protein n=1 Tax=Longimycelium tulufanense TaxID=907463 RepID=A0A8J3CH20_9PSEU|nr:hypothetical protein [Longimycelium tulufanense]GGM65160.1 hypothetical protein GCM10012275_39630 [Longimycelium tulufanense]